MKKMWDFFENMGEYVYVADIDSYELLYMNQKTLETFGFHAQDEILGRKCYEVLHGCSAPCSMCNNCRLEEGSFQEWQCYNPVLDKYLELKDTLILDNDRRCRFELAIDISSQQLQKNVIQSYQNLEAIANECFRIALQAPTPDQTIDVVLEYMGKALKGERTYIFEKNAGGGDDNTYEWVANGVTPEKDNLQNLPPEICANWYHNFNENKNIQIKNIADIRESDPLQYVNLKRQNIHSLVVIPLYDDKDVIGFYGVDNPPGEALDYAENMLQIMAHFIISSLKRRELLRELQRMSYSDRLTQFGNRFAMDAYAEKMKQEESVGVVYCDITGLKRVNDTEGHEAGDRLILRACECLKGVFGEYGLFRIGGDELVAICPGITEDMMQERMHTLKTNIQEDAVTMAVGSIWKPDFHTEIYDIMSEAEKFMYEDKANYYETVGVDRRK